MFDELRVATRAVVDRSSADADPLLCLWSPCLTSPARSAPRPTASHVPSGNRRLWAARRTAASGGARSTRDPAPQASWLRGRRGPKSAWRSSWAARPGVRGGTDAVGHVCWSDTAMGHMYRGAVRHVRRDAARSAVIRSAPVVRSSSIVRNSSVRPRSLVDRIAIVRRVAMVIIWMSTVSIPIIWVVRISPIIICRIPIIIVSVGRKAGGTVAARRRDRSDERDWEDAPRHDEPRSTRKHGRCQLHDRLTRPLR